MESDSHSHQKARIDKAERDHLEDVVEDLRERVEDNVRFQLTQNGLDDEPQDRDSLDEDTKQLVEATDLEGVDGHTWDALVKYIVGESKNFSDNLFQCFSTRFAEDSSPKLERSEIRCQFVL